MARIWTVDPDAWERIFSPKLPAADLPDHREIHITDVRTFLDCRRKWDYASPLRQGYQPLLPNMNLWLGRVMHEALAVWYEDGNARQTMEFFEEHCMDDIDTIRAWEVSEKFNDLMVSTFELGVAMLRHYIIWSRRHDKFDVLATELTGRVILPHPARTMVVGRMDLIAVDKAGKGFIIDHKTASRIPTLEDVQIDTQAMTYLFLAQNLPDLDVPVDYFMFNYLHKKEPTIPRVLNNGRLSKAALHKTSLEIYAKAVLDHGDTLDMYPDVMLELKSRPNPFFARYPVRKTRTALQLHMTNLSAIATEMLAPIPNIYPSPDRFKCGWCEFRAACMQQSDGVDPTILLDANFRRRKTWH